MINMNAYTQTQAQADNEVIINGVSFGYLTDTDTERIISIIRGMQNGKPMQASTPVKAPKAKAQTKSEEPKPVKTFDDAVIGITPIAVKGKVAFSIANVPGRNGAKLLIKSKGFAWDSTLKGADGKANIFVGTPAQAKELGITAKSTSLNVPGEWIQRASEAKAEKKAKRA